jgi:NAD(P)-dependent dehydrogenase (short-subunit alcohol dehydrogenase family)
LFDEFNLKEKVALVVGGGSGIGQAIACGFAKAGALVIVGGRIEGKLTDTVTQIRENGSESDKVIIDVRSHVSVDNAIKKIVSKFGKIDIVLNSAGTHHKKPSIDVTDEEWNEVIDTNLSGVFRVCRAVGHFMIQQKKGKIINIASLGSFVGLSEATAYCASKAGVALITKNLAIEWAKYNIHVNAIAPGVFRTSLNEKALSIPERLSRIINHTPMGRLGKTEELVGTAIYLASSASNFVTGAIIPVDGGFLSWGI